MQSKTSFFNKTLFRKNATRFAPVWVLYTLCLAAGVAIVYTNNGPMDRPYWFARHMLEDVPAALAVVNLIYALVVAQLLFGDLFSSRMCNAIHALPLSREAWFTTNVISGVCFSLVPTLVMAAAALPMMAGSMFADAWQIPFLLLLSANLQYLCFFGIAVFCAMCVANRFTMIAGYGLVNFGVYIAYWLVDTLYTPLLYGIITPTRLAVGLTPILQMTGYDFYDCTESYELANQAYLAGLEFSDMTATFTATGEGWRLFACGAVGIAFLLLALVLYRKRHLECAGDAVAFPVLVPVFQVLCSLFVMVALRFVSSDMFGMVREGWMSYLVLALALGMGWFIGRMLIERSTRVFRLKNFYGLGILAVAVALSFVGTYFDVLGLETRMPRAEKVKTVSLESNMTRNFLMEDPEDIAAMLEVHRMALEDRPGDGWGLYVRGYDGSYVYVVDSNDHLYDTTVANPEFTYVANIRLIYHLENGATMSRRYNIWTETGAGPIVREYMSRWDFHREITEVNGQKIDVVEAVLADLVEVRVEDYTEDESVRFSDVAEARSLMEAIQADCAAGTMAQDENFHKDYFQNPIPREREDGEIYYETVEYINVNFRSLESGSWWIKIYPDCEHTLQWLRDRDMTNLVTVPNATRQWVENLAETVAYGG